MNHTIIVICGIFFALFFLVSAFVMSVVGSVFSLVMLIWMVLGIFDEAEYEHRWEQFHKADYPRSIPIP